MKSFKFSIFTVIGFLALVGFLATTKMSQFKFMGEMGAAFVPPPSVVNSAQVMVDEWENVIYSPGELEAYNGVTVSAQFGGNIDEILFKPGTKVNKNDVLLTQDLASEKAQLASAKAAANLAERNLERAKPLLKSKDISQEDYDVFLAQYQQAIADVRNVESIIDKKSISAPFSGSLGISLVDVGQYLRPGDPIVTLQDISRILVNFSLPQRESERVQVGQAVRVYPNGKNGTAVEGKVIAISPEIDARTRNIRLQAEVANSEEKLIPGMFVDIELIVSNGVPVMAIPSSSVLNAPYGDSVFIIEDSEGESDPNVKVVKQTFVRLGKSRGDFVDVIDGLKEGDEVVASGLFKLFNGQRVVIDNSLAPDFKLDPQLNDS